MDKIKVLERMERFKYEFELAYEKLKSDDCSNAFIQLCKEYCKYEDLKRINIFSQNVQKYLYGIDISVLRALDLLITKLYEFMQPHTRRTLGQTNLLCVEVDDRKMDTFLSSFINSDWKYAGEYIADLKRFPNTKEVTSYKFYTHDEDVFHKFLQSFFGVDHEMVCETHYFESNFSNLNEKKVIISKAEVSNITSAYDLFDKSNEYGFNPNGPFLLSSTKILFGEFIPSEFDQEEKEKISLSKKKKVTIPKIAPMKEKNETRKRKIRKSFSNKSINKKTKIDEGKKKRKKKG